MDPIALFIAHLHQMLGHDKAAAVIGAPPYNKSLCILCRFERGEATKEQVQEQIGRPS